jgi:hypothetical protein
MLITLSTDTSTHVMKLASMHRLTVCIRCGADICQPILAAVTAVAVLVAYFFFLFILRFGSLVDVSSIGSSPTLKRSNVTCQ